MHLNSDAKGPPSPAEDWLWLVRAPRLGSKGIAALLASHGRLASAIDAGPGAWRAAGLRDDTIAWMQETARQPLAADLEWLVAPEHHLLTLEQADYPALLRRIPDPPAALFVVGDPNALWQPMVAVVGSRNATAGGLDHARDFAATLAQQGLATVSGLALGVDGAAHQACLDAGAATVAVLGTGVDHIYPARHRPLAQAIAAHGALVSEYPLNSKAQAGNFPRRNRIICGLALGTLVVEAGVRSGSLITARLSAEQGRDIFAIPGSVHNPMARGCHQLIRQGAKLVETAQEVIDELGPLARELAADLRARLGKPSPPPTHQSSPQEPARDNPATDLDPDYQRLLEAMGFDPVSIDELVERSALTVESVSSMLLILELNGQVQVLPGGRYTVIR